MRILISGTTYLPAFNGQAIFTTHLTEGLVQNGHQVCMVTPSEHGSAYQIMRNGVNICGVRSFDLEKLHDQAYESFFSDHEVKRIFETFIPEIVHLQDHFPLSKCVQKAARRNGLPIVGTNHFMPENLAHYVPLPKIIKPAFKKLLWWWMKRVYNHLDCVTAPSATAVELLKEQKINEPLLAISCGINFKQYHRIENVERGAVRKKYGISEDSIVFQFVGRVDAEKRLDVIIHAIHEINRTDIVLVVTGKGAAMNHYQNLVASLGVKKNVIFTGFLSEDDLALLLNSVDIFSMPSEAELLSIACLEAMACGLPLLAARSQALPELVDPGLNGYLFEPGDVADAVKHMMLLVGDLDKLPQMGKHSLEKVKSHSIENVIGRYETLYGTLTEAALSTRKLIAAHAMPGK